MGQLCLSSQLLEEVTEEKKVIFQVANKISSFMLKRFAVFIADSVFEFK